ncbi:MAG: hypothetical protein H0W64_02345 [Gammaproteobacteria bacterium]|nr:hypothetical protein [Gammaproteobacteria bacterium]
MTTNHRALTELSTHINQNLSNETVKLATINGLIQSRIAECTGLSARINAIENDTININDSFICNHITFWQSELQSLFDLSYPSVRQGFLSHANFIKIDSSKCPCEDFTKLMGTFLDLHDEITLLAKENNSKKLNFIYSLLWLNTELIVDVNKIAKEGYSPQGISEVSYAPNIASETVKLLRALKCKVAGNRYEHDFNAIMTFKKNCCIPSAPINFARAIGAVLISAIGLSVGIAIGIVISFINLSEKPFINSLHNGFLMGPNVMGITRTSTFIDFLLFRPGPLELKARRVIAEAQKLIAMPEGTKRQVDSPRSTLAR